MGVTAGPSALYNERNVPAKRWRGVLRMFLVGSAQCPFSWSSWLSILIPRLFLLRGGSLTTPQPGTIQLYTSEALSS